MLEPSTSSMQSVTDGCFRMQLDRRLVECALVTHTCIEQVRRTLLVPTT